MIYQLYQANMDVLDPLRVLARGSADLLTRLAGGTPGFDALRPFGAALDVLADLRTTHRRPDFGFDRIAVGNRDMAVREEALDSTPFATLLHFAKDEAPVQPRMLVVAPMSGHFSTLLRGTVRTLLAEHDVCITDWHNARDVRMADGRFGFDDFVDHIIRFLEVMAADGRPVHIMAVCQPAVAVLAAVALMAQHGNRAQPRSMTLMAGPIDTRKNPTEVNRLANEHDIDWFEQNLIGTVPMRYPGAFRRVYPGFLQLGAFMAMNLDRHVRAHIEYYRNLVEENGESAAAHRRFYDEYMAVMDLPAEFYLETVQRVFQDHDLPLGRLSWRGETVKPGAIRRTALLTVEGELDDICGIGQTVAAQDLCTGIRPAMKRHHLQTGAGHYGVFNGKRWTKEIYPLIRTMVQMTG
ncbi:MAG: polyhydroxyalkanoate depolymerase [Rhodospirillales bacterium]|nr:polyhydroxyalkanoate depolymerase [Rhodospirillales bacterium]